MTKKFKCTMGKRVVEPANIPLCLHRPSRCQILLTVRASATLLKQCAQTTEASGARELFTPLKVAHNQWLITILIDNYFGFLTLPVEKLQHTFYMVFPEVPSRTEPQMLRVSTCWFTYFVWVFFLVLILHPLHSLTVLPEDSSQGNNLHSNSCFWGNPT